VETTLGHYGQWGAAALFIALFALFLLFVPFYRKSQWKPSGAYLAFIVAFALEMFGVPASLYVATWVLGHRLPEGVLWGHTLVGLIGYGGLYLGAALMVAGGLLVIFGWSVIHRQYWAKEAGRGHLVTGGLYGYIRHPQYTGFLLITLGMLVEWATIPLLIMWPIMVAIYYHLARKEESDMEKEFGPAYGAYRQRTGMFLPRFS
jgi:protein-S-isoprenylcysteine O-methyltransferase Ste14